MAAELTRSLPNHQDIDIYGGNYPVAPAKQMLANVCRMSFMASLGLGLFGNQLGAVLPPAVMRLVADNKGALMMGGFILNIVGSNLAQSGAFEVTLDGEVIYSKLEAGKVPPVELLREIILQRTLLDVYGV